MTGRSPPVARDNTHNSSSDTAMAENPNPELRKKRKKENDDNNNENSQNNENNVKKRLKARNRAHLIHQYSVSKECRQQQLFHVGSDASANYFLNVLPTEERVREGIEEEAEIQHNLSSAVFIEIGDGDEREVLSKDEVNAATDQARTLQEAKGLSKKEHAAFIEELFAFSVDEYEKKENENESESERAEEENGFLFFPNSVICLLLAAMVVTCTIACIAAAREDARLE